MEKLIEIIINKLMDIPFYKKFFTKENLKKEINEVLKRKINEENASINYCYLIAKNYLHDKYIRKIEINKILKKNDCNNIKDCINIFYFNEIIEVIQHKLTDNEKLTLCNYFKSYHRDNPKLQTIFNLNDKQMELFIEIFLSKICSNFKEDKKR